MLRENQAPGGSFTQGQSQSPTRLNKPQTRSAIYKGQKPRIKTQKREVSSILKLLKQNSDFRRAKKEGPFKRLMLLAQLFLEEGGHH